MKLLSFLLVASLAYAFDDFPSEHDKKIAAWFVNISRSTHLSPMSKIQRFDFDALEQKIIESAQISDRISKDPESIKLIRRIHQGFLGPEGHLLREMLVLAARDPVERDSLIRAIKYDKGIVLWPGWDLVGERFWSGSPKVRFTQSQLKQDIDALENRLLPAAEVPEWLKVLKASDLKPYEQYFKLFLHLEPKAPELLAFAIRYAQFLSCQFTLKGFFESLNSWLTDKTNGLASILAAAKPRTAR